MALEAYPTESFGSACVTEEDMYRQAYIKGAKAVLALFEEEIDHHRCPEHGYFCVEAYAIPCDNEFLCDFSKIPYFDNWEKVKLIIVKEE